MAGVYIHIPFCKKRCLYCDFFSSTSLGEKEKYVDALCREMTQRKDYLNGEPIQTIYFGGGTPSLLSATDFEKLFSGMEILGRHQEALEITLEANPDDLSEAYLQSIAHLPFNRISIGIQSFNDNDLKFLNRRHTAQAAIEAVNRSKAAGFNNISIDLMYGLPGQTPEAWEANLRQATQLDVQHVSAYHLIYEENTRLYTLWEAGKIAPVDESVSLALFELLIDQLTEAGFEHYEISNFARPGFRSKHNTSYWNGTHYLGLGASAHSYNGVSRSWNSHSLLGGEYREAEREEIDSKTAYNDYIITRLRTSDGIDLCQLTALFGEERKVSLLRQAARYRTEGLLQLEGNRLALTRKGIFISDGIMSELME